MTAIELFLSYSHKDEDLRKKLETHLMSLQHQNVIRTWHDGKISPGAEWEKEIHANLERAQIILLLISADFIASKYCYGVELSRALERHRAGQVRVVPVILRPCDWQSTPIGNLQAVPKEAKPVTLWKNRDEAFADIAAAIRKVSIELSKNP